MLGGLIVVAVGIGAFLYLQSAALKTSRADEALGAAEQSFASGNLALAQSDLEKMVMRYDGTSAAHQGTMLLALVFYQQGKYQEGVAIMRAAVAKAGSGPFATASLRLLGDGYLELGTPAEAADSYKKAAQLSAYETERARLRLMAAGAYALAGNQVAAAAIWEDLAKSPTATVANEARLRLGQHQTKPATRG
jgi:hypothetical protein